MLMRRTSGLLLRAAQHRTTAASGLHQSAWLSAAATLSLSTNPHALHDVYKSQVDAGEITYDPVQMRAVEHLDALYTQIMAYGGPSDKPQPKKPAEKSWWQRLTASDTAESAPETEAGVPKGLYLHGGVGCGKTFVMDMFFDHIPVERKLRVHFHKFMLDIHKKMHELRKQGRHEDPIPFIVDDLLQNSWLLCFDEFQVTDVADAMILRRLFSALLDRGFIMVATSNRPPSELYKNGVQRDLFLPFIDQLYAKCEVVSLDDSGTDYRVLKSATHAHNVYNFPLASREARGIFAYEFLHHCKGEQLVAMDLTTQGRKVHVPQAAVSASVCEFSFEELCDRPLGAADYIVIAEAFSVVFVRDIPKLSLEKINQMRRFITFVDCMYDKGVRLHCLADASVEELYHVDVSIKSHVDEVFAFDRTVSRLLEMGSEAYLLAHSQQERKEQPHLYLAAAAAATADEGTNSDSHEDEATGS